jgi:hypothetical protein
MKSWPTLSACLTCVALAFPAGAIANSFAAEYKLRACPEPVLGADGSALRYARTRTLDCRRAREIVFTVIGHGRPYPKGYSWQLPDLTRKAPRVFDGRLRSQLIAPDGFRAHHKGPRIAVVMYSHPKGFGSWKACDKYVLEANGDTALAVTNNWTCQVERLVLSDYAADDPDPGRTMQSPGPLSQFICAHNSDQTVLCENGDRRVNFSVETY